MLKNKENRDREDTKLMIAGLLLLLLALMTIPGCDHDVCQMIQDQFAYPVCEQ